MRRRRAREECIARVASESYVAHADREYIPLCPGSSSKREANARVLLDERERERELFFSDLGERTRDMHALPRH